MRFSTKKLALSAALCALLSGCFDSGKSTLEEDKAAVPQQSEIRIAMMQPPRTGLSPLSDDAFK